MLRTGHSDVSVFNCRMDYIESEQNCDCVDSEAKSISNQTIETQYFIVLTKNRLELSQYEAYEKWQPSRS